MQKRQISLKKIQAKAHKTNKQAIAEAIDALVLPVEEPTRQSERLKEQAPVENVK